ncbi:ribosome recycling factor [bacterium]|nr:ribosome recycling factor [bacterium]|tara:strand:- start:4446 stop:5003 length:558 start_codon:yes stop_codon:yes gene_type:complete
MFNEYYDAFNADFQKSLDHMDYEFSKLQTGRANSSLFEDISVEAYGSAQPMKNVAQITIPDSKTVSIKPFDKSILKAVESGIISANLNLNPNTLADSIIINIPPLTEERRRDLVKVVKKVSEETKVTVRQARQKQIQKVKELLSSEEISRDDMTSFEKKLQELVDNANSSIDTKTKEKESDILKV